MRYWQIFLFITLTLPGCLSAQVEEAPTHGRPYFMPQSERDRIQSLIQREAWAQAEYVYVKEIAEKGDGYWSAFLYALEGDSKYLPTPRAWLLKYGEQGGDIYNVKTFLNDPGFFKGGQPSIPQVYYNLDVSPMIAYDWVYNGLSPEERKVIEDGILTSARFRMRCMDRWSETPNLVFKPTYMVAMAGLVTGNKELLDWGFHRKPDSSRGGYFHVLNAMLKDGGPWAEAPIYPIAHESLSLMIKMSWYRKLFDGKDWFADKSPGGGSPKGLIDYYMDTGYPIELTGYGSGQIRVVTYGDGSTSAQGDLFLVNPAGKGLNMIEALASAYNVSGDSGYAAFLSMSPDYKPNLVDRRPLPEKVEWPFAPSKVWPNYGLAMLRSDESPAYWTSGKAVAVFQIMTQGYGHDHHDKFSITLHGAGRLFYPDYNAIQYENPAIGWTRNTIAHNTLMVDEGETRNAIPTNIRHEFTSDVKFLATSASGVFEGVDQTRALLLTQDYLLDLFHATSKLPHTYDYILHSFGKPRPTTPEKFKPSMVLGKRFWLMENQQVMATDDPWSLDFVIKEAPGSEKTNYGREWYDYTSTLRLSMAAEPETLVVHGMGAQNLPMLVARRSGIQDTVFVVTHEPFARENKPKVKGVANLVRTQNAIVVRVATEDYTDYMAVAFGPQKDTPKHALLSAVEPDAFFAFKNYGYLRVMRNGKVTARGGWIGFRIPGTAELLTLNGQLAQVERAKDYILFGEVQKSADPPLHVNPPCPLRVKISPTVVRLAPEDGRMITLTVENALDETVSGRIEFELPENLEIEPASPEFGSVHPGNTVAISLLVKSNNLSGGRYTIPYRVLYRSTHSEKEIRTAIQGIALRIGPVLEFVYQYPDPSVYQVNAPRYLVKVDMFHGLIRYLAADDQTAQLDGNPLFTFSDGKKELLSENTKTAFTWPVEIPALLSAHVYNRARYRIFFFNDRFSVTMDRDWTQFEKTFFTLPGIWISSQGPPRWKHIISVNDIGKELDVEPGLQVNLERPIRVAAAELAFPNTRWNLCFEFKPAQEISFTGTGMKFQLGSLTGDRWSVGFCKPGELDTWRWRDSSATWDGAFDKVKDFMDKFLGRN
jgi:hypothetical protein